MVICAYVWRRGSSKHAPLSLHREKDQLLMAWKFTVPGCGVLLAAGALKGAGETALQCS